MKLPRTKAQEVTNTLFGRGKYAVAVEDIQDLIDHFDSVLRDLIGDEYVEVLVKFLEGDSLNPMEVQRKFHLMRILKHTVEQHPEVEPTFLTLVDYSQSKEWALSDVAEAVYGKLGDAKIHQLQMPDAVGEHYTTAEVKKLLDTLP